MSSRPYLLATERTDLVPGNLRDGATPGVPFSATRIEMGIARWRIAPKPDGMLGVVCIFRAPNRTDNGTIQRVQSEPRYLRNEPVPYYHLDGWDMASGRWTGVGAHGRADELFPVGPPS